MLGFKSNAAECQTADWGVIFTYTPPGQLPLNQRRKLAPILR
jgi:hypothetical protein